MPDAPKDPLVAALAPTSAEKVPPPPETKPELVANDETKAATPSEPPAAIVDETDSLRAIIAQLTSDKADLQALLDKAEEATADKIVAWLRSGSRIRVGLNTWIEHDSLRGVAGLIEGRTFRKPMPKER